MPFFKSLFAVKFLELIGTETRIVDKIFGTLRLALLR